MTFVESDIAIYQELGDALTRYATMLVGPTHAPDVVHDAVLAAFASRGWADVTNRRAYLYRAVYNRAVSIRRSDSLRGERERRVAAPVVFEQPEAAEARSLLSGLSPQQRAVVYLTYWDDLTPAQIAVLLDVGEGTVRKQLARARETLRRILDVR